MPGLSFEHIPPIHIPFRFFNTAPWMGVLAGLVLLPGLSESSFVTQWNAQLLAMTHLFTLGFMAITMIGALFQVLPVISGETIPASNRVASVVHLALLTGTLLLATAFVTSQSVLFTFAVPVLLLAFIVFLVALGTRLIGKISGGDSINAIRFAALSLLVTILFGATRALSYYFPVFYLEFGNATHSHILWGLAGWLSLLVMGVSFQVIPMFHVTPNFSANVTKYLPLTVFLALTGLSILPGLTVIQSLLLLVLCVALEIYAGYAIWLLSKRRRKLPDTTVNFWRLSLGNCALVAILVLVRYFDQVFDIRLLAEHYASTNIVIGILAIAGFACSVIIGMLHKIIPFLVYMHLQRSCGSNYAAVKSLPNMLDIIPAKRGRMQLYLHCSALVLLLGATLFSPLEIFAASAIVLNFAYLGYTINSATWRYWKTSKKINSSDGLC